MNKRKIFCCKKSSKGSQTFPPACGCTQSLVIEVLNYSYLSLRLPSPA
ncbi:MAG: hypothetical protein LBP59_00835 [Planctomycetaceae bacterium]|nr:hypothetical protein [Planctomycetaceae bacterium]